MDQELNGHEEDVSDSGRDTGSDAPGGSDLRNGVGLPGPVDWDIGRNTDTNQGANDRLGCANREAKPRTDCQPDGGTCCMASTSITLSQKGRAM